MVLFRSIVFSFLLFFTPRGVTYGQAWNKITAEFSTGDTVFSNFGWHASMVTSSIGWFVTESNPGYIFKTTDGGNHWGLQKKFTESLYRLFALDTSHVWIRHL